MTETLAEADPPNTAPPPTTPPPAPALEEPQAPAGAPAAFDASDEDAPQPLGAPVPNWSPPPRPPRAPFEGRFCRLEPLDPAAHADALHAAYAEDATGEVWRYLGYGPFANAAAFRAWTDQQARRDDPLFFAILAGAPRAPLGVISWLRISPHAGAMEVGHLNFAPALQRTPAATEAMYLMMRAVFTLGYRRYEWKCDALNARSRRAAQRFGFSYEGVFRQARVVKGRNRDTAWYAAIDREWPALRSAYEAWLAPENFDAEGRQIQALEHWTSPVLAARG